MSAVTRITPHVRSLNAPDELKHLPGWLMWRLEEDEHGKARKIPFYTSGERRAGQNGSPTDRAKLTTFEAARTAAARRGFDGVGLALMPEFDVTVLDFDHCVDGDQVDAEVLEMVSDTYAELSPSGTGVHAVYRGRIANAKAPSTRERWGFETFSDRGFVTWTGNVLEVCELLGTGTSIAPLNDQVIAEVNRRFGHRDAPREPSSAERLGLTLEQARRAVEQLDPDLGFEHWLRVGMALHHELGPQGLDIWDQWSARGSKYKGTDNLLTHWRTFGRGRGGTPVTMRSVGKMLGVPLDSGPASAEEFDALVEEGAEPEPASAEPKALRFKFEPVASFASTTAAPWIVKGVLPQAGLAVIYGASGAGKSFAVLDIALAIARGETWRGCKVRQGKVAYVAAEGAEGFRKRLAAYAQHHAIDLSTVPMAVLNGAPNLLEVKDAADLVIGVKAAGGAEVIVIDTLAQTMPGGNENAGEDMGKALGHCKRIHEKTGALVILIHHSGKDQAKGARGWSGLRAAADAEIEVIRDDQGQRSLRLSKSKDGEDGLEWGFELQQVQLGVDEDLDPITSCIVLEAELKKGTTSKKLGPVETIVNAVLSEMSAVQQVGIEIDAVVKEAAMRMPDDGNGRRDTRSYRAKRALMRLLDLDDFNFGMESDGTISVF